MRRSTPLLAIALAIAIAIAACGDDAPAGDGVNSAAPDNNAANSSDNNADNNATGNNGADDAGNNAGNNANNVNNAGSDAGDDTAADVAMDADPDGAPDPDDTTPDAEPDVVEETCAEGWADTFAPATEIAVGAFQGQTTRCLSDERFIVAAGDTALLLEIAMLPEGAWLEVVDLRGDVLATAAVSGPSAAVEWTMPRSGEVRVRIRRPDGLSTAPYSGLLTCASGCDREATRYPIVLIHGMAGTDRYFGILEYFYEISALYQEHGYLSLTTVAQFIGHSEARAPVIAEQLDTFLAETGAPKVHLIGHSQGGLDMRVLVSGLGYADRVASMTTVATPHNGIDLELPEFLTGMNFSSEYLRGEFKRTYPDVESIPRFSWAGRSCSRFDEECKASNQGEEVDLILGATWHTMRAVHGEDEYGGANDGIVPVASAIWGELLGILPADHFDQVGQIADRSNQPFDHRAFYLSEARRLRALEIERGL